MFLRVLWLSVLVAGGCTSSSGGGDDGTMPQPCDQPTSELEQEIHAPITLTAACSPYHASTPITAYAEVDVEPGVVIQFADGTSFATGTNDTGMGKLVARGTAAKPIVFDSDHAGAPGSWDFVDIEGAGASELHYVAIHGAGGAHGNNNAASLEIGGDVPTLLDNVLVLDSAKLGVRVIGPIAAGSSGLHVESSAQEPIEIQSSQLGTLPAATFDANVAPYILVDLDDVAASATWVSQPIPFHVPSPLLVYEAPDHSSVVLTVQANTFLFDAPASFEIGGEISAANTGSANLIATDVTLDAFDPTAGWAGLRFVGRYDASSVVTGTVAHGTGPGLDDVSMMITHYPTVYIEKDATANAYPTLAHLTVRDTIVPPPDGGQPKVGTCIGTSGPMIAPPPDYAATALANTFTNCGMSAAYWDDLN